MGISLRPTPSDDLLRRVRDAYRETPNLRLTPSQAQRLFDLEPVMCVAMLEGLVTETFLLRTRDGMFIQSATPNASTADGADRGATERKKRQGEVAAIECGGPEAERESLERILRLAGWLPHDTQPFRNLHRAARGLQTAADLGVPIRDALYALEVSEQQVPASATLRLLRSSTRKLHTQLEASGLYASDASSPK